MIREPTFSRGMRGELVRRLQVALYCEPTRKFDSATQKAVEEFQAAQKPHALPITGTVTPQLWELITKTAWPDHFQRVMFVTASFEGHDFTEATNDNEHDHVGITWGIIGFTLISDGGYGKLYDLLKDKILPEYDDLFDQAFGTKNAATFREKLKLDASALHTWAKSIARKPTNGTGPLLDEWQQGFRRLGAFPEIQELQLEKARAVYKDAMVTSKAFALDFNMAAERTDLMFMDIFTNAGSFKGKGEVPARQALQQLMLDSPGASLREKLWLIRAAHMQFVKKKAAHVPERKSTIAKGYGIVNGWEYRLDGWGISMDEPQPLSPVSPRPVVRRSAVLNFDTRGTGEQWSFARAMKAMGMEETSVETWRVDASDWKSEISEPAFGIEIVKEPGASTLSTAVTPLIGSGLVDVNAHRLHHAVHLMFREPVDVLVIMGQYTKPIQAGAGAQSSLLLGRKKSGSYVGLALQDDDQLLLTTQSLQRNALQERALDITDIRSALAKCQLLLVYASNGIPWSSEPKGCGERWQRWLNGAGARPIVLGWYGLVTPPPDHLKTFVAEEFFARVSAIKPNTDLRTLCQVAPDRIIQAWGEACHARFAKKKGLDHLWRKHAIPLVSATQSGCGAIAADGTPYYANVNYTGQVGTEALVGLPL